MSAQIICVTDHSPDGAKPGALLGVASYGDVPRRLEAMKSIYPNCELKVVQP